jgi:hypothetical protein
MLCIWNRWRKFISNVTTFLLCKIMKTVLHVYIDMVKLFIGELWRNIVSYQMIVCNFVMPFNSNFSTLVLIYTFWQITLHKQLYFCFLWSVKSTDTKWNLMYTKTAQYHTFSRNTMHLQLKFSYVNVLYWSAVNL